MICITWQDAQEVLLLLLFAVMIHVLRLPLMNKKRLGWRSLDTLVCFVQALGMQHYTATYWFGMPEISSLVFLLKLADLK